MDYYAILTTTGAEKLAETQAQGEALELATFAVGDGNGQEYEPTATQTALRHQTWSGGVSRVYHSATDANVVCIEGAIPTDVGGFTIREVGIFDGDGDLIFVANEPSIVKAATTESFYNDLVLKIEIGFSSDVNITVTASTVALATAADLDALRTETTANLEALRDDVDELIDNVHSVPIDGTQGQVLIKGAGETYGWGDNDIVAIDVTYPSVFAGTVMTLRGNGQTVTSTLDSNGKTMFLSRKLGTYTVSDAVTGQTTTINATQTGGYNVTLDKPYVTVTLSDSAFIGETLTFAGETKTVGSDLTVVFVLDSTGAYTLSNSLNTYTEVINVTENREYPVTLTPVVITVPLGNAAFEGETVYLDGGGTRYAETVGSNLSVSFKVGTGSYTVSNSVTSDTETINASTAGVYTATTMNCATITVTCTDDDFLGMTVRCYSGSKSISKVVGTNLVVTFAVGLGDWTIYNPIKELNLHVEINSYTNYPVNMSLVMIYGIKRNLASESTAWTRTDDSVNFTATASVGTTAGASDFDACYPWSDMTRHTLDTNDVMVWIPEFWYQRYQEDGYEYIKIFDRETAGVEKHPGSGRYIAAYETSSTNKSVSGATPTNSVSRATSRTNARNKGTGWGIWDLATISAIQMLYLVEYADNNASGKLGQGYVRDNRYPHSTGGCDDVANLTGRASGTDSQTQMIYRGIEDLYGNHFAHIDGLNSYGTAFYVCTDPNNYADETITNYTQLSYNLIPSASGTIKTMGMDSDNSWAMLPNATTDSTNAYYYDYLQVSNSTGWGSASITGSYNTSGGGVFAMRTDITSTASVWWGSRLMYIPS